MPHVINSGVSSYTFEYPFTLQPMRTYLFTTYFFTHHYSPPPSVSMSFVWFFGVHDWRSRFCFTEWLEWMHDDVCTNVDIYNYLTQPYSMRIIHDNTTYYSITVFIANSSISCIPVVCGIFHVFWFPHDVYMQNASDIPSHRVIYETKTEEEYDSMSNRLLVYYFVCLQFELCPWEKIELWCWWVISVIM